MKPNKDSRKRATKQEFAKRVYMTEQLLTRAIPEDQIIAILMQEGISERQAYRYKEIAKNNQSNVNTQQPGLIWGRYEFLLQQVIAEKDWALANQILSKQTNLMLALQKQGGGKASAATVPTTPQSLPRELEKLLEELGTDRLGERP